MGEVINRGVDVQKDMEDDPKDAQMTEPHEEDKKKGCKEDDSNLEWQTQRRRARKVLLVDFEVLDSDLCFESSLTGALHIAMSQNSKRVSKVCPMYMQTWTRV